MPSKKALINGIFFVVILLTILACFGIALLLQSKTVIFTMAAHSVESKTAPFPVSVDPIAKTIEPNTAVDTFFVDSLAKESDMDNNFWVKLASIFIEENWYQSLASPVSRIAVIWPGDRKEEAVKRIGDTLRWTKEDRETFTALVDSSEPALLEGKYYPGQYITHRYATPYDIYELIEGSFHSEVIRRYTSEVEEQVPLENALIIASLLEREASDFENMREVSGVIWNRIFIDMPLQLDATLQYIKGSRPYERSWWPAVRPNDKFITSPFNTYKNAGLPPAPIANPSAEAILAALNPVVTDCLFYFHARGGKYYCSPTYKEHVSKLRSLYGRGS